jgi:hypothetical protein
VGSRLAHEKTGWKSLSGTRLNWLRSEFGVSNVWPAVGRIPVHYRYHFQHLLIKHLCLWSQVFVLFILNFYFPELLSSRPFLNFFCTVLGHINSLRQWNIQGAAEITATFQRGITNKWYEVSPKTFYFPNVDITKFFTLGFQNYIVQMVAVTADTHLEPFFLNGLL